MCSELSRCFVRIGTPQRCSGHRVLHRRSLSATQPHGSTRLRDERLRERDAQCVSDRVPFPVEVPREIFAPLSFEDSSVYEKRAQHDEHRNGDPLSCYPHSRHATGNPRRTSSRPRGLLSAKYGEYVLVDGRPSHGVDFATSRSRGAVHTGSSSDIQRANRLLGSAAGCPAGCWTIQVRRPRHRGMLVQVPGGGRARGSRHACRVDNFLAESRSRLPSWDG